MNNYLSSPVALCDSLDGETGLHLRKKKELTDRALKLAEAGKSKSNWELQGILRVAAFVLGFLVGK
jgi:hypothetical protein